MTNKNFDYFERKVQDLQLQNEALRGHLANSSKSYSPANPQAIIQLQSRNERLQRQAYKYERSIRSDLSGYLLDSMVQGECFYRNRYNRLLSEPKNHYRLYF